MEDFRTIIQNVLSGSTNYSEETIREAAISLYHNQPAHDCYWNNRFYLAIKFDLPEDMKREAAQRSVWNGEYRYWEWKTHAGYDMVQCLRDLGITEGVPESLNDVPDHLYIPVDQVVMDQIKERFDL